MVAVCLIETTAVNAYCVHIYRMCRNYSLRVSLYCNYTDGFDVPLWSADWLSGTDRRPKRESDDHGGHEGHNGYWPREEIQLLWPSWQTQLCCAAAKRSRLRLVLWTLFLINFLQCSQQTTVVIAQLRPYMACLLHPLKSATRTVSFYKVTASACCLIKGFSSVVVCFAW